MGEKDTHTFVAVLKGMTKDEFLEISNGDIEHAGVENLVTVSCTNRSKNVF